MKLSLLLNAVIALAGGSDPQPENPWLGAEEAFHRDTLERVRRGRAFLEENNDWEEKLLDELAASPDLFPPAWIAGRRKELARIREEVERIKQYEQILEWHAWARRRNPGPETDNALRARLKALRQEWDAQTRGVNLAPSPREGKKSP